MHPLLGLLILVSLWLLYTYCVLYPCINKWQNLGIPNLPNPLPVFGHVVQAFFGRKSLPSICEDIYRQDPKASMCGFYFMSRPALLIRDPSLVKRVLQTEFANFQQNTMFIDPRVDPTMAQSPFFSAGEAWKAGRVRATASFAKKKLQEYGRIARRVCDRMIDFTDRETGNDVDHRVELELQEYFARCMGELVANCLGFEGHFYNPHPAVYSFKKIASTFFPATKLRYVQQMMVFYLPKLADFLGIRLIPPRVDRPVRMMLSTMAEYRLQTGEAPKDFLQAILDHQRGDNGDLDKDALVADVMSFYFDTYGTMGPALAYHLHDLANQPEHQEAIRAEVRAAIEANGGELTLESLEGLFYLDRAILESLRLRPLTALFMKVCTGTTQLEGSDGLTCRVAPGDVVIISATALHQDPRYWQSPGGYRPERFADQERVEKFAYLPFGAGPRMCTGMEFAMMLMKLVTGLLVDRYAIETSLDKNEVEFSKSYPMAFLTYPKNGVWVRFRRLTPEKES